MHMALGPALRVKTRTEENNINEWSILNDIAKKEVIEIIQKGKVDACVAATV